MDFLSWCSTHPVSRFNFLRLFEVKCRREFSLCKSPEAGMFPVTTRNMKEAIVTSVDITVSDMAGHWLVWLL